MSFNARAIGTLGIGFGALAIATLGFVAEPAAAQTGDRYGGGGAHHRVEAKKPGLTREEILARYELVDMRRAAQAEAAAAAEAREAAAKAAREAAREEARRAAQAAEQKAAEAAAAAAKAAKPVDVAPPVAEIDPAVLAAIYDEFF